MNDPRRWTDDGGEATALERELVRAGRDAGPSQEQRRMMWGAIAAQAIPSATGQGAAPASGPAASTGLTVAKGTVIVALIGAGIVASYRTMRGPIPPITQPSAAASAPAPHEQPQLPSVSPPPGDAPGGGPAVGEDRSFNAAAKRRRNQGGRRERAREPAPRRERDDPRRAPRAPGGRSLARPHAARCRARPVSRGDPGPGA